MSNYFEDFKPGQTFKHWPGRTITEFDNTWFTLMTMNTNPIHFDAAYAAKSQHGQSPGHHPAGDLDSDRDDRPGYQRECDR